MTLSPEPLLGREALGDAVERLWAAVDPRAAIDGWATVELDRAVEEVAAAHADLGPPQIGPAGDARLLGARCRLLRFGGDRAVLLLEPSTEGRLAAALARFGEGRVARYLLVDAGAPERARRAGFALGSEGRGPFGPERLVIVGPRHGPFLVLAGFD
ncbi:MAG TPA: hypothetical protein VLS28_00035 [Candidatus Sulfomarinibacteraceae bacterium]|nr:hypothetical protein [Candidatus Sulfomarinibacteraceae bacterium]